MINSHMMNIIIIQSPGHLRNWASFIMLATVWTITLHWHSTSLILPHFDFLWYGVPLCIRDELNHLRLIQNNAFRTILLARNYDLLHSGLRVIENFVEVERISGPVTTMFENHPISDSPDSNLTSGQRRQWSPMPPVVCQRWSNVGKPTNYLK